MSNELTITPYSGTYSKNSKRRTFAGTTQQITVTEDALIDNVQEIGTAAGGEALALGDVSTPRWARFKNLDDTDFVEVGFNDGSFQTFIKLLAGEETGWLPISQAAPYARADTAAAYLDYTIIGT